MAEFKPVLTAIFLMAILIAASSSGETSTVESHDRDASKVVKMQSHGRRRRGLTEVLDYDYGAANSRHDPHRKPGNGH